VAVRAEPVNASASNMAEEGIGTARTGSHRDSKRLMLIAIPVLSSLLTHNLMKLQKG